MHEIRPDSIDSDMKLTLAVLQIGQLLGLYNAELARILGLSCADIGAMSAGNRVLRSGTAAGSRAGKLVRFYALLFETHRGDTAAMHNWLRRVDRRLKAQPLLLLVDEDRMDDVIRHLASHSDRRQP